MRLDPELRTQYINDANYYPSSWNLRLLADGVRKVSFEPDPDVSRVTLGRQVGVCSVGRSSVLEKHD